MQMSRATKKLYRTYAAVDDVIARVKNEPGARPQKNPGFALYT
jgi:hypothetical protein